MEAPRIVQDLDRFDVRLFTLGGTPITLWDIGFIVVALIVLFAFTGFLKRWIDRRLAGHTHLDVSTRRTIATLVRYKSFFQGNVYQMPGQKLPIKTNEGTAAVDEAVAFLQKQAALTPETPTKILADAAGDHTAEQRATGATGHNSADGSNPGDRVRKRGGGPYVAEVIAYGPADPVDMVRQLIVDDGVANRGHRVIIYSPELTFAGASCGPHPKFRTVCVVDLAMMPDGSIPPGLIGKSAKAPS